MIFYVRFDIKVLRNGTGNKVYYVVYVLRFVTYRIIIAYYVNGIYVVERNGS